MNAIKNFTITVAATLVLAVAARAEITFLNSWVSSGAGTGQFLAQVVWQSALPDRFTQQTGSTIASSDSAVMALTKLSGAASVARTGVFSRPNALAVSLTGQVYVADSNNNRVQRFNADGGFEIKWGSNGSGDGQFFGLDGLEVSPTGQVYVADTSNHRIQVFDSGASLITEFGGFGSDIEQFNFPRSIAIAPTGQVYIADGNNNRVQRFFDSDAWVSGINEFVDSTVGPIHVGLGSGELLGQSLHLDPGKTLTVAETTSIEADGELVLNGGLLVSDKLAFNEGLLVLESSTTLTSVTTLVANPGAGVINTNGHDLLTNAYLTGPGAMIKANSPPANEGASGSECEACKQHCVWLGYAHSCQVLGW